jgi:hypothetical protein
LTSKYSRHLPLFPRVTQMSIFVEFHVDSGEMPSDSAWASTNGLYAEPGWRWPWVARLNGRVA